MTDKKSWEREKSPYEKLSDEDRNTVDRAINLIRQAIFGTEIDAKKVSLETILIVLRIASLNGYKIGDEKASVEAIEYLLNK